VCVRVCYVTVFSYKLLKPSSARLLSPASPLTIIVLARARVFRCVMFSRSRPSRRTCCHWHGAAVRVRGAGVSRTPLTEWNAQCWSMYDGLCRWCRRSADKSALFERRMTAAAHVSFIISARGSVLIPSVADTALRKLGQYTRVDRRRRRLGRVSCVVALTPLPPVARFHNESVLGGCRWFRKKLVSRPALKFIISYSHR